MMGSNCLYAIAQILQILAAGRTLYQKLVNIKVILVSLLILYNALVYKAVRAQLHSPVFAQFVSRPCALMHELGNGKIT